MNIDVFTMRIDFKININFSKWSSVIRPLRFVSIALLTLKILSTEALLGNGVLFIQTFLMLGVSSNTNKFFVGLLFKKLDTSISMEMLEFELTLDQENLQTSIFLKQLL